MTIGSNGTPTGQLYVSGNVPTTNLGSTSTSLNSPVSVFVSGQYAYIASYNNNELVIDDVSNPANPTFISEVSILYGNPDAVYVQGHYAYVASVNGPVSIYDVSNPSTPNLVGTTSGWPTGLFAGVSSIYVQGHYLYVVSDYTSWVYIYDVSNPANPTYVGENQDFNSPYFITVQGNYAYIINYWNNNMEIMNVSNPANPTIASNFGSGWLSGPLSVYVSGRYAYISSSNQ